LKIIKKNKIILKKENIIFSKLKNLYAYVFFILRAQ
jgi:hypothetical protein